MAPITSFIRWAGGKSWLVPYVAQLTEGLDYNNYFEPFMGGASIFFSLELHNKGCLSDINEELIKRSNIGWGNKLFVLFWVTTPVSKCHPEEPSPSPFF